MASAGQLRSVARNIARATPRLLVQGSLHGRGSGPRPALWRAPSSPCLFSSFPTPPSSSTPPPPINKDLLAKAADGMDRLATTMGYFVVFGGVIFYFGWMKPAVEEIREGFATAAIERSNIKDQLTSHYQMVDEQFAETKERVIAAIDSVLASSQFQAHKHQHPVQGKEPDGSQAF